MNLQKRNMRMNESFEEVSLRRQSDRLYKAKVRDEEMPEQTAQRRQSDRLHKAKVRDEETPEQTTQRRQSNKLNMDTLREEETPEQTVQRRQSDRLHMAKVRDEETPEQTTQRRQSDRLHKVKVRDEETPEQTTQRRQSDRLHKLKVRDEETPEQTTKRRQSNKLNMDKLREEETPKQTVQRRQSDRLHKAKVRDEETPEQTTQRRQSNRLHKAKVRDEETPEQTTQRRQSDRLHKVKVRDEETPEQTTQRRQSDRLHKVKVRDEETPEQTTQRRQFDRLHKLKVRDEETPEQTTKRRQSNKLNMDKLREEETPEQTVQRRQSDRLHKAKVRDTETSEQTTQRRQSDRLHKAKVRDEETSEQTTQRKQYNRQHRAKVRNEEHPEQTKKRQERDRTYSAQRKLLKKQRVETVEEATNNFKSDIKKQPVYICTSCHRLLWKKGVRKFDMRNYNTTNATIKQLVLNDKYRKTNLDGSTYICFTCHKAIKENRIPTQSKANGLDLEEIPDKLKDLNNLEIHLLCKRIIFMKLVKLPRGKQRGIKGAAVNVPADLGPACTLLPRIPDDAHIISLKLKRKLEYKHAYLHDTIRPEKVLAALHYLKNNNPLYSDIEINENWIQSWKEQDEEFYNGVFEFEDDQQRKERRHDTNSSVPTRQQDELTVSPLKSFSFLQLEKVAKKRGFVVKDVTGDGHCMFAAVLRQMEFNGYQAQSIQQFRDSIAVFMEENSDRYRSFVSINFSNEMNDTEPATKEDFILEQIQDLEVRTEMLWQRFLRRLKQNAWGDHIVIQAIAHMLNITITILEHRENYPNGFITVILPNDENEGNVAENALHLGFIPQHHYTSLEEFDDRADPGSEESDVETSSHEAKEDMIAMEENCKLRDIPYDTCLQNELPEEANQIFSLAPGEGNRPIPLLTDTFFEELANPEKFPHGKGGYTDTEDAQRHTRLTLKKYINACLLDQDGRFAKDIEYIFAMQYTAEHKHVKDSINIALRKTSRRQQFARNLQAGMLRNLDHLQNLFKKDKAYSFLKDIRGSPSYWQKMFYETLAMIRTLGIPTWFFTLSAADMKWPEVSQAIARQHGTIYTENEVKELPWRLKSMWLRTNPVTAARMFQYRLDTFMTTFIKSSAQPIGPVTDFVIRIEFQARGSPHAHTLMWVKDAPKLGTSNEEEVKWFIEKYVSCSLPEDDEELRHLVESLQIHNHSPTCRRKGKCRFNYPKPPSPHTIISDEPEENCQQEIEFASNIGTTVKEILESKDLPEDITLQELLKNANVSLEDYIKALSISKCGRSIILKRKPSERKVNCYSPTVLKAWEANMDIQFVVNAYACVMYVASYVLKAEKGMGELLKQAAKEVERENIRTQLSKVGSIFLTNREVSAQEATYRALSMPLRRCSRTVLFINTDTKECRSSLLLPMEQIQKLDHDDENVFCKNIIDRYSARPDGLENISLAQFAANYTYSQRRDNNTGSEEESEIELLEAENETHSSTITLKTGLGKMRKRKRQAVIRWHNFNIENESEKHYRSRLMLFLPWREEGELQGNYISYEDRYNDELERIKPIEELFTHQEDEINDAFQNLQAAGPPQAAWDNIAPGSEEAQELAQEEGISDERPMAEEDIQANIEQFVKEPTISRNESMNLKYTKEASKELLSSKEYNKCMQVLNKEQKEMVMYHRKWCKETVLAIKYNKPVKPYCIFLSGPGGVGKSFVVKMIHTDTVKLLRCAHQIGPEDVPILLTAATGVAAHNISGITIHSAFVLNERRRSGTTYYSLGADTLNTLQAHLEQLMVVVIDEISMVGAEILYKIHMRLQEIKRLQYTNSRFGNVTIIAVGDLYQLPPFKDKKIYHIPGSKDNLSPVCLHGSLWQENFQFHELTQVVRQKNQQFVELLNRVRIAKINEDDEALLKSRITTLQDPNHFVDALHVYGTNEQADRYNSAMLEKLNAPRYCIKSSDIRKDKDTRQVTINLHGKKRRDTGGLESNLVIAENAIVKLTCNINVADGLANGVRGIIQKIITKDDNSVHVILVKFEDKTIGEKAKTLSQYKQQYPDSIPIHRFGATFQYNNKITVFRSQFPLVLAWACTIHSVQGLTVDKIVVDLSKIFAAGQAYVALSRVKTLEGLQILNYKKSAIRKDKSVEEEMLRLQSKAIMYNLPILNTLSREQWFTICHLNVRGYLDHLSDVKADHNICSSDVIGFTETHLRTSDTVHNNSKPTIQHVLFRTDRLLGTQKGGTMIFAHTNCKPVPLCKHVKGLEFTGIIVSPVPDKTLVVITIYRRSNCVTIQQLLAMLEELLSDSTLQETNIVIMGDFNEDLVDNYSKISNFLQQYGFHQLIKKPTTDQASLLDHMYYNDTSTTTVAEVCDTYYSDHDCTFLAIRKDSF